LTILKTIFNWGVAGELVPAAIADSLSHVKGLRKGKTTAPESPKRKNVSDKTVERTLPLLPPVLQAMIRIQHFTGMRPSEVYNMRVGDLDLAGEILSTLARDLDINIATGEVLLYCPEKHKNAWRGDEKIVPLNKIEQQLIEPYLAGKEPDEFVFSPQQAMKERRERLAENRKIKITPSQMKRHKNRLKHPKNTLTHTTMIILTGGLSRKRSNEKTVNYPQNDR
jgi:integrase